MTRLPETRWTSCKAAAAVIAHTHALVLAAQLTQLVHHQAVPLSRAIPHMLYTHHHHLRAAATLFYVSLVLLHLRLVRPTTLYILLATSLIIDAVAFPFLTQPLTHVTLSDDAPLDVSFALLRLLLDSFLHSVRAHPPPFLLHVSLAALSVSSLSSASRHTKPTSTPRFFIFFFLALPLALASLYPFLISAYAPPPHPELMALRLHHSLFHPPATFSRSLLSLLTSSTSSTPISPSERPQKANRARAHYLASIHKHNPITDHPNRLSLDPHAIHLPHAYTQIFNAIWRRKASPVRAKTSPRFPQAAARLINTPKQGIILILMESTGTISAMSPDPAAAPADNLSMTYDPLLTPNLHAIFNTSRQAILFDRLYTSYPASAKSVGAILTGHAPTWGSAARKYLSPHNGPSALPSNLRKLGYRTAFFSASLDLDWDWTRWLLQDSLAFDHVHNCQGTDATSKKLNSWTCQEEIAWQKLTRFVTHADRDNVPFFAVLFTTATHFPYSVSPRFRNSPLYASPKHARHVRTRKQADYFRTVSYTDDNLGTLVRRMNEQKALADRTLFAFIGDHGEAFGGRHKGNVLHRNNLYEENIRLSFMLAQPCFKHPEKAMRVVDHRPASNINVALTLLRAAGDTAANRSLVDDHDFQPGLDLLARQNDDTGNLAFFVKRANQGRAGVIDGDWKFTMLIDEPIDELQQGGILDAQSFDELYYLADDPQEKVNLLAGGNVKDDLVQQRGRRYAALVELWYGMADCVYQEQFSSLTMHPFCRTVHLYRGVEGRLREVTRVERVDDGIRILFDDSSILRRRGLVHVTDVGQCGDAVCEPLSAAVMVANQDFSKADQCGNSDMKAVFEVAAEQVDVFVRVPQRLQSDTLSVRVFDLLGAQVALLADCFITFPES